MKYAYTIVEEGKKIILTPDEDAYELQFASLNDFKPMYDNVIIQKDEVKETTEGGIYLTDSQRENTATGVVTAVGNGRLNEMTGELNPLTVKVGDRVLFVAGAVQEFECGTEKIHIIKEKDILSIIK